MIGGLLALLLVAGAVAWLTLGVTSTVHYTTVPVTQGSVTRGVTTTGAVNPELTIIVGTYVSGVIQQLYCDYNTQVKKGQVCAKIDPRPYQTVVDQNKAN
ncbi:MAG: efflux RND transporter periplasmic adaptor subunit, partial [Xanthobacteraceae bacterium]